MFKYRVLGSKMTGNGKRLYTVLNMTNSETFTVYGKFFSEKGDSEFINLTKSARILPPLSEA